MTALTASVAREEKESKLLSLPVAANAIIFRGALVKINAAGYVEPCATESGAVFAGTAREGVDATGAASGDYSVLVEERNSFYVAAAGIVAADLGKLVYASDDNTVALVDSGDLQEVGKIIEVVSATKVLVQPDADRTK